MPSRSLASAAQAVGPYTTSPWCPSGGQGKHRSRCRRSRRLVPVPPEPRLSKSEPVFCHRHARLSALSRGSACAPSDRREVDRKSAWLPADKNGPPKTSSLTLGSSRQPPKSLASPVDSGGPISPTESLVRGASAERWRDEDGHPWAAGTNCAHSEGEVDMNSPLIIKP